LNKLNRIAWLASLGFNTPVYFIIFSKDDLQILDKFGSWSIRSFCGKKTQIERQIIISDLKAKYNIEQEYFPPHLAIANKYTAKHFCSDLLDYSITPICCKGIDPKDALFAGAALKDKDEIITLEIAIGPVMVRKVTRFGQIDFRYKFYPNQEMPWRFTGKSLIDCGIKEVLYDLNYLLPKEFVVELSYYKRFVGIKKRAQIYWDIYPLNQYPNTK